MKGRLFIMRLNVDEWQRITGALSTEEVGALMRACVFAWDAPTRGEPAASIPDDDDVLERLLGARWKKAGWETLLRRHFKPHDDHAGFLVCPWLREWYAAASAAHLKAVNAGRAGGHKRAENHQRRSSASSSTSSSTFSSANVQAQAAKAKGVFTHTAGAREAREDQEPRKVVSPADIAQLGEQWRSMVGPKEILT